MTGATPPAPPEPDGLLRGTKLIVVRSEVQSVIDRMKLDAERPELQCRSRDNDYLSTLERAAASLDQLAASGVAPSDVERAINEETVICCDHATVSKPSCEHGGDGLATLGELIDSYSNPTALPDVERAVEARTAEIAAWLGERSGTAVANRMLREFGAALPERRND